MAEGDYWLPSIDFGSLFNSRQNYDRKAPKKPKSPSASAAGAPAILRTNYTGYVDSRLPPTTRAGDADILVRGPNYVWSLLNTRGGRTPTAYEPKTKRSKAKRRSPGNDVGLTLGIDPIGTASDAASDTVQPQQTIFNQLGIYYDRILGPGTRQYATKRPSAAGRTNRTGAKSTRPLDTDGSGVARSARPGSPPIVSGPGYWDTNDWDTGYEHGTDMDVLIRTGVNPGMLGRGRPKSFEPVKTDPNSTWQPARTSTQGEKTATPTKAPTTKDPGNANPIPTGPATASTGPPKWWTDYVMPLIDALKKGKSEPKERTGKTAKPSADTQALLGMSAPSSAIAPLTAVGTSLLPSTQTATSTTTCECPPKRKPRRNACRNPVISRLTKGGVRTTKVRIVCQPSKRK